MCNLQQLLITVIVLRPFFRTMVVFLINFFYTTGSVWTALPAFLRMEFFVFSFNLKVSQRSGVDTIRGWVLFLTVDQRLSHLM